MKELTLAKQSATNDYRPLMGSLFLAMALHQAGKEMDARKVLAAVIQSVQAVENTVRLRGRPGDWIIQLECRLLRLEAEELIVVPVKKAEAHTRLGHTLRASGKIDEAIANFRKVTELTPNDAMAFNNLGAAQMGKNLVDEAITSYRKAITLNPGFALAQNNLGYALFQKGQLDEAISNFRRALSIEPKNAWTQNQLARAQRLAPAQGKLTAFQKGEFKPTSNDERLTLAELAQVKKQYRTAAALLGDAVAADPKLADDLKSWYRYNAACYATLAAAGQGEESAKLDDSERIRLRKQALDWLRADLTLLTRKMQRGNNAERPDVLRIMKHWQQDSDLAGIRDEAALAKLPAEQRAAFARLWAEVAPSIAADDKGVSRLEACDAALHGNRIGFETSRGQPIIAYWDNPEDWVSWTARFDRPGTYEVTLELATLFAGPTFVVEIDDEKVAGTGVRTADWWDFREFTIGRIEIKTPGAKEVKIRVKDAANWKAINVRVVRMKPTE